MSSAADRCTMPQDMCDLRGWDRHEKFVARACMGKQEDLGAKIGRAHCNMSDQIGMKRFVTAV